MKDQLIIGIDGGATKTQLAIADINGNLLDVYESGGTYFVLEDAQEQMDALLAHIAGKFIKVAVFTVAGWDFKPDQEKQQLLIETAIKRNRITVKKIIYENDIFSTLKSAKNIQGSCAVISCGTGIIGLAARDGYFYKTPGYEYLSGEWGSGIHQAEYGIHLACASLLGRGEHYPILVKKALSYFEATDADSLAYNIVNKFTTNRQRGYFLKEIHDAYNDGCRGAALVIDRAGEELARTAWCLIKNLKPLQNISVIFSGGVIKEFGLPPLFASWLKKLTGKSNFNTYIIKSAAVYGALLWALEIAHVSPHKVEQLIICDKI